MASNKNQHFVPRCYLKPFTFDAEGLAISLFNIDRRRFIQNAPVKNQCAGDYFYGKDLKLEKALQGIEGMYAMALSRILSDKYTLTDEDQILLRSFWLLQYMRTDAASRRTAELANGLIEHARAPEEYRMSIREAVQLSMSVFIDMIREVSDLKICLLRNRTQLPYVACDDPAIMTNRWHLHDDRARWRAMGVGSAGALFLLPLSPNVMCVVYDGDVYSIPHQEGWADVRQIEDVAAFNEHQFLNCRANIFFRDWPDSECIREEFDRLAPSRPGSRYRINMAVFDKAENGHERYRVMEPADIPEGSKVIIHNEAISPKPSAWPSVIAWRSRGTVYTNGTGLGFLRRARAEDHGIRAFEKIRIH